MDYSKISLDELKMDIGMIKSMIFIDVTTVRRILKWNKFIQSAIIFIRLNMLFQDILKWHTAVICRN